MSRRGEFLFISENKKKHRLIATIANEQDKSRLLVADEEDEGPVGDERGAAAAEVHGGSYNKTIT